METSRRRDAERTTIVEESSPCILPVPEWIAGHPVAMLDVDLGPRCVRLYTIRDLEGLVDRAALLRGDAEPPYWAYLWSGARVLASYLVRHVELSGLRVLEVGCGLGLPGVTAAVLGADVTLVDGAASALDVATASAAANGVRVRPVIGDFLQLDSSWRFDLVLAAEVAYERERYAELAAICERHLEPGGMTLLADGYRTDTRGLYAELAARPLRVHAIDVKVIEEGRPISIRLAAIRPKA
jgi:predicted nicotinamide N-methyase